MDESIEVAQLVEASWGAAEPLGISLNRDLTIKELEASAAQKGLTAGMSLQTVGKKNVQGFAYDGVLAIIERNKKPGKTLVMTFGRGPPPAAAPAPEPERPRGASLPPGGRASAAGASVLAWGDPAHLGWRPLNRTAFRVL